MLLNASTALTSTAYWIAFGPHGPRAEAPPGETGRIVSYTLIGIGVSAVVFFFTHHFARKPPRSMTKEWQEASNEYMKVCLPLLQYSGNASVLTNARSLKTWSPSLVFRQRATQEEAWCRARRQRSRASAWNRQSRLAVAIRGFREVSERPNHAHGPECRGRSILHTWAEKSNHCSTTIPLGLFAAVVQD